MKLYYKEPSELTPLVSLNPDKGVLIIDGSCNLEEPEVFLTVYLTGSKSILKTHTKTPF